jgi:uncharacterized phage protein gp47/JayE
MPWTTQTLEQLRALNRDNVQAQLHSGPLIPNSVLRVIADSNSGLAYLTLLYLDWLAKQLMPDTAETEWLDRFGEIWRPGGSARKAATYGTGVLNMHASVNGTTLPNGSLFSCQIGGLIVRLQSTQVVVLATADTPVPVVSLVAGVTGIQADNEASLVNAVTNVIPSGNFASFLDGVPEEEDDELRTRVLDRIRQPPMGGDAEDYVQWATAVPGVTRAWCSPNEMGLGTITVRFMMDDLRATTDPLTNGFPLQADIDAVYAYLQTKRPVAIKDFFVVAPIAQPINFTIVNLTEDTNAVRAAISVSVNDMLMLKAAPQHAIGGVSQAATLIHSVWITEAILAAQGVDYFSQSIPDFVMPNAGSLAVLGTISYVEV